MDNVKIENFIREHPALPLPAYRTLTAQESERIKDSITVRLGLPPDTSPLDLVCHLAEKATAIEDTSAEDDNFNLKNLMKGLSIEGQEKIFINWYRFDDIDEINLDDLSRYFDDIWYPGADAIDLFDVSLKWILSIDYSGNISLLKFP